MKCASEFELCQHVEKEHDFNLIDEANQTSLYCTSLSNSIVHTNILVHYMYPKLHTTDGGYSLPLQSTTWLCTSTCGIYSLVGFARLMCVGGGISRLLLKLYAISMSLRHGSASWTTLPIL